MIIFIVFTIMHLFWQRLLVFMHACKILELFEGIIPWLHLNSPLKLSECIRRSYLHDLNLCVTRPVLFRYFVNFLFLEVFSLKCVEQGVVKASVVMEGGGNVGWWRGGGLAKWLYRSIIDYLELYSWLCVQNLSENQLYSSYN